ncbi:uncharacterized protein LOC128246836 isoform X3 [Mya arenaria]|uniref:uncharacterized protein LOC128246836 isoform X3 n=1 Tax=Mya arenaria TaxID=6604 RepID=UPI0022E16079|nr:uncharacterized protein LOC128246836 isoform X3 [Mya arenaria]
MMLYLFILSLAHHGVHTQGLFKEIDSICIGRCFAQKDWEFNGECPQSFCDRQCADQRLALRVGYPVGTEYHCALNFRNRTEYRQTWAVVHNCSKGEQPYISFFNNAMELPSNNGIIVCDKCNDSWYYNSEESTPSNTYHTCTSVKRNRCTHENHKLSCGIPWEDRKESDGFCRCDYEHGYAPNGRDVPSCFYSKEECSIKTCPSGNELVSNYSCVPVCPQGYNRDKTSRQCLPNIRLNVTVQTQSKSTRGFQLVTPIDQQTTPAPSQSFVDSLFFEVTVATAVFLIFIVICMVLFIGRIITGKGQFKVNYTETQTGQGQKTNFGGVEVNIDIPLVDRTPDATPEKDRSRNQQSKASGSAEYGVCPVYEDDQPLISTHHSSKQASSVQQPIQEYIYTKNFLDRLEKQETSFGMKHIKANSSSHKDTPDVIIDDENKDGLPNSKQFKPSIETVAKDINICSMTYIDEDSQNVQFECLQRKGARHNDASTYPVKAMLSEERYEYAETGLLHYYTSESKHWNRFVDDCIDIKEIWVQYYELLEMCKIKIDIKMQTEECQLLDAAAEGTGNINFAFYDFKMRDVFPSALLNHTLRPAVHSTHQDISKSVEPFIIICYQQDIQAVSDVIKRKRSTKYCLLVIDEDVDGVDSGVCVLPETNNSKCVVERCDTSAYNIEAAIEKLLTRWIYTILTMKVVAFVYLSLDGKDDQKQLDEKQFHLQRRTEVCERSKNDSKPFLNNESVRQFLSELIEESRALYDRADLPEGDTPPFPPASKKISHQTEQGHEKTSTLYDCSKDSNSLSGKRVHLHGAMTSPGLGKVSIENLYVLGDNYVGVFFEDRKSSTGTKQPFCVCGDSGAMVMTYCRKNDELKVIGMIIGEQVKNKIKTCARPMFPDGKPEACLVTHKSYVGFKMTDGLKELEERHRIRLSLCCDHELEVDSGISNPSNSAASTTNNSPFSTM